jgi:hypothetical protein
MWSHDCHKKSKIPPKADSECFLGAAWKVVTWWSHDGHKKFKFPPKPDFVCALIPTTKVAGITNLKSSYHYRNLRPCRNNSKYYTDGNLPLPTLRLPKVYVGNLIIHPQICVGSELFVLCTVCSCHLGVSEWLNLIHHSHFLYDRHLYLLYLSSWITAQCHIVLWWHIMRIYFMLWNSKE